MMHFTKGTVKFRGTFYYLKKKRVFLLQIYNACYNLKNFKKGFFLMKTNLETILKTVADNQVDEVTVIFFLEDDEYGYGYTYHEERFYSQGLQDRFSKEEITREDFDEMLGMENRTAHGDVYDTSAEAVEDVLTFYTGMKKGKYDNTLDMITAVEVGRKEGLDYIVF